MPRPEMKRPRATGIGEASGKAKRQGNGSAAPVAVPPHDLDAERFVLASMMADSRCIAEVTAAVTDEHYFRRDHQLLHRAIVELHSKGDACDAVTLADWLNGQGITDLVGEGDVTGASYLLGAIANSPHSVANVAAYVRIVQDKAMLRRAADVLSTAANEALNPGKRTADEILAKASESITAIDACRRRGTNAVSLDSFLAMPIEPREVLLDPWLKSQSLGMIAAFRGLGKTHIALGIANAVASAGAFLKWRAPVAHPVLYIDGEMSAEDMQQRLRAMGASGLLRIITPDLVDGPMPDLSTPEGQARLDPDIRDARLIIVDNLSSLARTGIENDAESWNMVAAWALRMRRERRSVLFIHHAGKGGQQRGTSKREDPLDVSIMLSRPPGYTPSDGASLRWEWSKARGIFGDNAATLDVKLETDALGRSLWTWRHVADDAEQLIAEMHESGKTVRQIAADLGLSKSAVARKLTRVAADADAYRRASGA